ncbi:MAG: glycosyltransferase [Bacilli bacterium]|nr:glycosyltransferase [Bacilli bacterium]
MKLSIIIPVKNQSAKLLDHLKKELFPYFNGKKLDYEVIVCSDASDRENQRILEEAMPSLPKNVFLLPYEPTKGKGHAVQRGLLEATGDYSLFLDADFATDLKAFDRIEPRLSEYGAFIGSRNVKGSRILTRQSPLRRILHWGSRTLIRSMFGLKVHDTQCGFKLFRSDVGREIARHQRTLGFAFDAEYCYFLKLNGIETLEIPVVWSDDPDSSVKNPLQTSWLFFKDLRRIKKRRKSYVLAPKEREGLTHAD